MDFRDLNTSGNKRSLPEDFETSSEAEVPKEKKRRTGDLNLHTYASMTAKELKAKANELQGTVHSAVSRIKEKGLSTQESTECRKDISLIQRKLHLAKTNTLAIELQKLSSLLISKPENIRQKSPRELSSEIHRLKEADVFAYVDSLGECHLVQRYRQLLELPPEQHGLSKLEILKIAYFTSYDVPKMATHATTYFKKEIYNLPRSVVVDAETGAIFLLSKRKVTILDASGTYKKVTSAIALPLLQAGKSASLVAQAVSKDEAATLLSELRHETAISKELRHLPGIWPEYSCFEYLKNGKIQKISTTSALAEGDLKALLSRTLSTEQFKHLSFGAIVGLDSMHSHDYVHGDIKPVNILFGGDIIGLIDFGFTFKLGRDKPTVMFASGYYGTVEYTAPELFGAEPFQGDHKKTDVFALGMSLYQLYFKQDPPWAHIPKEFYDDGAYHDVTPKAKAEVKKLITNTIEKPLATLLRKKNLTDDDKCRILIYQMMRLDPSQRIDIHTAKQA